MITLWFIPFSEIERIRKQILDPTLRARILADIFRINTLYMIMRAGSGHLGTCFSSMDIVTWLWTQEMVSPNERGQDPSDTYFSSKGHDVPALYALLIGLGKLDFDYMHKLRRLDGLPGHPDIGTPYMVTNTGSLGMGISKARGMAMANRLQGKSGRFYVLTGDGELQEGQIWESLQPTANHKFSEITVIVDHNKIQSDIYVKDTSDLGDLEKKFRAFGWEVARCDGHDFEALHKILTHFKTVKNRPQILIADTLKGKGVSFMERLGEDGFYHYHSGAPSHEDYTNAFEELRKRVDAKLEDSSLEKLKVESMEMSPRTPLKNAEKLISAYGDELVKIGREQKNLVALDADLVLDTGLVSFKKEFPERYVECGIAEQDMISLAGGLALGGMLPIVHSFECFMTTRANEQFYNNATEKTKIIYAGSLAGLLPGMPGHSHQSMRGISILGSIPGLTLIEPSSEKETRMALRWAVEKNKESSYIRLVSIPLELAYGLPESYELQKGKGVFLREGSDVALIGYGPVLLNEAIKAAEILGGKGIGAAVINLPWLNFVDEEWLITNLSQFRAVFTLDDHYVTLGQGTMIASTLAKNGTEHPRVTVFGVEEIPACGQNDEVLKYHRLDHQSLAERIEEIL